MIKRKFYEYESFGEKAKVVVEYSQYSDYENTAVMLKDAEDGALWSVLSVNISSIFILLNLRLQNRARLSASVFYRIS